MQIVLENGRPTVSFAEWAAVQRAMQAAVVLAWRADVPDSLLRAALEGGGAARQGRRSRGSDGGGGQQQDAAGLGRDSGRRHRSAGAEEGRPAAQPRQPEAQPRHGWGAFASLSRLGQGRLASEARGTAAFAATQPRHPQSPAVCGGRSSVHGASVASAAMERPVPAVPRPAPAWFSPLHGGPGGPQPPAAPAAGPAAHVQPAGTTAGSRHVAPFAAARAAAAQELAGIQQPRGCADANVNAAREPTGPWAAAGAGLRRAASAPPHPTKRLKAAHKNPAASLASGGALATAGAPQPLRLVLQHRQAAKPATQCTGPATAGNGPRAPTAQPPGSAATASGPAARKSGEARHAALGASALCPAMPSPKAASRPRLQQLSGQQGGPGASLALPLPQDARAVGQPGATTQAAQQSAVERLAAASVKRRRTAAPAPLSWAEPPRPLQPLLRPPAPPPLPPQSRLPGSAGAASQQHLGGPAGAGRPSLGAMLASWENPTFAQPSEPPILSVASVAAADASVVPNTISREDLEHVQVVGQVKLAAAIGSCPSTHTHTRAPFAGPPVVVEWDLHADSKRASDLHNMSLCHCVYCEVTSWACAQVDCKFVVLLLLRTGVLAVMDQHAADERVCLEALQVGLFPGIAGLVLLVCLMWAACVTTRF